MQTPATVLKLLFRKCRNGFDKSVFCLYAVHTSNKCKNCANTVIDYNRANFVTRLVIISNFVQNKAGFSSKTSSFLVGMIIANVVRINIENG